MKKQLFETFFTVMEVDWLIKKLKSYKPLREEKRSFNDAVHYVLSRDIFANEDIPLAHRATMDGYAVRSIDTVSASESNPVYLECVESVCVEKASSAVLCSEQAFAIVTGAILPEGADAVVMQEYTQILGENTISVHRPVTPFSHVLLKGEDAQKNALVFEKGTLLRPQEIGMLASLGIIEVYVYAKPSIAIFSTGDEIISPYEKIELGLVRDANTYVIASTLASCGCEIIYGEIVKDTLSLLQKSLSDALQKADIVLLSGGSSIGSRDYTIEAIESIENAQIITHGVAMQPGKPTIWACVEGENTNKYICGLPGQMASAQIVVFSQILPFVQYLYGREDAFERRIWNKKEAILTRNISGSRGKETWIRLALEYKDNLCYATPILGKSALLKTMIEADALFPIPENIEGFEKDSIIQVYLI
ncbi:MAG: molybdopterin molybdotransferase MoeA [Desulfovibrionaceae bacterium]